MSLSMHHFKCFADERNKGFCVHCGGPDETVDHVPSKVLLDEPYPDNLIVCSACRKCNSAFSLDEEYLACILECVLAGEANTAKLQRPKIAAILTRKVPLRKRIIRARSEGKDGPVWAVETDRIKTVVIKLARGHAAYEYNEPQLGNPSSVRFVPLMTMRYEERANFESCDSESLASWPEVGSRAMQRHLVVNSDVYSEGWLVVQEGNYRFKVTADGGFTVRIVLREYLACEVVWE